MLHRAACLTSSKQEACLLVDLVFLCLLYRCFLLVPLDLESILPAIHCVGSYFLALGQIALQGTCPSTPATEGCSPFHLCRTSQSFSGGFPPNTKPCTTVIRAVHTFCGKMFSRAQPHRKYVSNSVKRSLQGRGHRVRYSTTTQFLLWVEKLISMSLQAEKRWCLSADWLILRDTLDER